LIFGSGLQDRLMIFRIHDHELWLWGLVSSWTLQLSKSSHANSTYTFVKAKGRQRLCE
jgi:hypothetical protein